MLGTLRRTALARLVLLALASWGGLLETTSSTPAGDSTDLAGSVLDAMLRQLTRSAAP